MAGTRDQWPPNAKPPSSDAMYRSCADASDTRQATAQLSALTPQSHAVRGDRCSAASDA